jgi:hypothetical protein
LGLSLVAHPIDATLARFIFPKIYRIETANALVSEATATPVY